MTYCFSCPNCGFYCELERTVAERDRSAECTRCAEGMRRIYTPPQLVTRPFHLAEGNRFHGDKMDRREYDRKYNDEARDKRNRAVKEDAIVQAQMRGAEVVSQKDFDTPSLVEMAQRAGARIRG